MSETANQPTRARPGRRWTLTLIGLLVVIGLAGGYVHHRRPRPLTPEQITGGFPGWWFKKNPAAYKDGHALILGQPADKLSLVVIITWGNDVEYAHYALSVKATSLWLLASPSTRTGTGDLTAIKYQMDLAQFIRIVAPDWSFAEAADWLQSASKTLSNDPSHPKIMQKFRDRNLFAVYDTKNQKLKISMDKGLKWKGEDGHAEDQVPVPAHTE